MRALSKFDWVQALGCVLFRFGIAVSVALFVSCNDSENRTVDKTFQAVSRDVSFVGIHFAWIVTQEKSLLRTRDGGAEWEQVGKEMRNTVVSVSFFTMDEGWLLCDDDSIWRSSDGGATWKYVTRVKMPPATKHLRFVDETHGWMIEPFSVWRTVNAGIEWQQILPLQNSAGITEPFHSFYFLDSRYGLLCGERGVVYWTTDGGVNWSPRRIASKNVDVSGGFLLDRNTAWIVSRPGTVFYQTNDGGASWQAQELPSGNFDMHSIFFVTATDGWAVGGKHTQPDDSREPLEGTIVRTRDGGKTWLTQQAPSLETYFFKVFFADENRGWLVGNRGVYRTEDGGLDWHLALRLR